MSAAICSKSSATEGASSRKQAQGNQVTPTAVQPAARPGAITAQPSAALCRRALPFQPWPRLQNGPDGQEKAKTNSASCCEQPAGAHDELGRWGWLPGEGQGAGPPHVCPRLSALQVGCALARPRHRGVGTKANARAVQGKHPSSYQEFWSLHTGACKISSETCTAGTQVSRRAKACPLPRWPMLGQLQMSQLRSPPPEKASKKKEHWQCWHAGAGRLPHGSRGPGDGPLCPARCRGAEGQDGPRAGGKAHPLLQELPADVLRCSSPDPADFWKTKARHIML